jgi:pimeloyl-ACP methyl ester carboxylesterase
MAEFVFNARTANGASVPKKVYYETHGEGSPILLLNGIMMSTKSWASFVRTFSERNQLILMDFLDQGQSSLMDGAGEGVYDHSLQIGVIAALLDHLSLQTVNICGISYGAETGLGFAVKNPARVRRLLLFNAGARTAPLLRDIGRGWNEAAKSDGGLNYYLAAIPVIYSDVFYETRQDWMRARQEALVPFFADQEVKDRLVRLTNSSENFDVRDKLNALSMPVLVVTGANDYLIPAREQEILLAGIQNAHHVILPECGHASMYEKPLLFSSLALGFINARDDTFAI